MYYLRSHQERAKVDGRRSALDRGHSCLVERERLEVILPVVQGGDEEVGGSVMGGDAPPEIRCLSAPIKVGRWT